MVRKGAKRIARKPDIPKAADSWVADAIDPDVEITAPTEQPIAEPATKPDTIKLEDIKPRENDTRSINKNHSNTLMESIRALGLIEPIVTDTDGVLLAGGHRYAALVTLIDKHPKEFAKHFPDAEIPVRRINFRVADDEKRALAIEVGENEHRRNYSASEIKSIAERLKAAGYKPIKGRKGKEDKPLMPVLMAAVGLSKRRINEILQADRDGEEKSERSRPLSDADKQLQKAIAALEKWQKMHGDEDRETGLIKEIPRMVRRLRKSLPDKNTSSD